MDRTFTKSMAWLHTWAGVSIGSLLFAIFWMGTLSVFDLEIDRWMMPQTRLVPSAQPLSLDRVAQAVTPQVPAGAAQWRVDLPTAREPVLTLSHRDGKGQATSRLLDPASLAFIPEQGTEAGSGFIFPFHYSLHVKWMDLGKWLVGAAAMSMLVLLVSGVVIHKKILAQFFTFRPRKRLQRSALDLHNLTGVLALPFHFMITLSGLIIFITIYFPTAHQAVYGSGEKAKAAFSADAYGRFKRAKANAPGTLGSLDAMQARAEAEWRGGRPYFVRVFHPGDANSYVELRRSYAADITMNLDQIYFDAASGALLHRFEARPVMTVQRFMSGIHFIRFDHWTLRWLYFAAGLCGCVLIATGFLFWIEGRRASHAKKGLAGVRVVEGLAIGSVSGIMLATLAFFVANRVLPLDAAFAGVARAQLEMGAFWLAWLAAFAHAWLRPAKGWSEQAWAIAALALLALLLNWSGTGDHPLRTLGTGLYAVAGMDAVLLGAAAVAAMVARRSGGRSDA
ncbi:PepSY domain-containing protein [Massilia violaceinigra]|uniref:PepSY domain-containing protein n=1 Tax=Massilia violaceinigra TaxID=2045208 RepID=A0ABY4AFA5_9BURK|nr:PepSY-associated TM helix domain-containing protein [Massilia violaceinigra]UOD32324.1 PepSY domain-containing protein [Massilia violaceinigra]